MSLILALLACCAAWASGSVVWIQGTPDPTLAPDLVRIPVEVVAPEAGFSDDDDRAIQNLAKTLEDVRPLVDVFDGELAIMARLEAAIAEVEVVRDERDRRLLYAALVFQGFAVQRYFQDTLGTDAAAARYRVRVGGTTEVKPWVDAVALDPDHVPDKEDISEEPERRALDEARARLLVAPKATLVASGMPAGALLLVDGRAVDTSGLDGHRVRVAPGFHRIHVMIDRRIRARAALRLDVGQEHLITMPPSREDLDAVAERLVKGTRVVQLPMPLAAALARLPPPVHLAVPDKRRAILYRVEGSQAVRATEGGPSFGMTDLGEGSVVRIWTGGAWLHDGNYYALNAEDGAPHAYGTVNAAAPVLGAGGLAAVDTWRVGGGIDLLVPTGAWHALPSGQRNVRLRAHPYGAVGIGPVQGTVGVLFPWHATLGIRAAVPLLGDLELTGAAWIAPGVPLPGRNSFRPYSAHAAFLAVSTRLGGE